VRLATLFHDLGKPHVAWRGTDGRLHYYAKPGYAKKSHEQVSAELANEALLRLRYPTDLRTRVVRIVRAHMMDPGKADELRARRLLQRYGTGLTFDLLDHKEADLAGKHGNEQDLERMRRFRKVVEGQRTSAHRIRDLAVNGDDLMALGYKRGPAIGRALQTLLDEVVRSPELNTREQLLGRAKELQ
jgi:tRNA nucleotidyltransferase (CCA-adding enzyme)